MNTSGSNITRRIKQAVYALVILFALTSLSGQTQDLVIGTAVICPEQEVLLPVTAYNITDAGAITLFITFDTLQLEYLSLENIDPQLNGMSYNFMTNPPQLAVAWSSLTGISFPNTKFFDLHLYYHQGATPVTFTSGCEISDVNLQIIPVNYISGNVEPANPVITLQPRDTTIIAGQSASFSVATLSVAQPLWMESTDDGQSWTELQDGEKYSGTHTLELTIQDVPESYDQYQYKCVLAYASCSSVSDEAILTVDTLSSLLPSSGSRVVHFANVPNPFVDQTRINYHLTDGGFVQVEVFYLCGKKIATLLNQFQSGGHHELEFDGSALEAGMYLCRLSWSNENQNVSFWRKITKINR